MEEIRLKFKRGYQKKFLLHLMRSNKLSQRKLSKELSKSRSVIRSWISEKLLLPYSIYQATIEKYPLFTKYQKFILTKKPQNWGQIKGGKKRYDQLKRRNKFKEHLKKMLKNIIKSDNQPVPSQSDFFKKIKVQNINLLAVLISLLMTDGYLNKNYISFTTTDKTLLNVFTDIVSHLSKANIKINYRRGNIIDIRVNDRKLVKKLLKYSPTYKTSPKNQTKKDYLIGPQPTIKYLFKQNLKTKLACIRIALSTDGCLTFGSESKNEFKRRAKLILTCAHPLLIKEWKELFDQVGLKCWIMKHKKPWAGVKGIASGKLSTIKKFKEIGGFVERVKISGKSKFLKGYEKNRLLNLVCNYSTKSFKNWEDVYKSI